MTDPDVHAPPAAGASSEEGRPARPGDGAGGVGNAPPVRSSVAESLADIRADRIIAEARREAQAIVDAARVDARREARAIVDGARAEAEGIITEAFEQRARIVRRDWAIGDGEWAVGEPAEPEAVAGVGGVADDRHPDLDAAAVDGGADVAAARAEMAPPAAPPGPTALPSEVVAAAAAPSEPDDRWPGDVDGGNGNDPQRPPHPAPTFEVAPPPVAGRVGPGFGPLDMDPEPGPRPSPDAARVLAELIESPALRAHRAAPVPLSSRPDDSGRPRPPLPVRRRGEVRPSRTPLGRGGPPPPPAPPPPGPERPPLAESPLPPPPPPPEPPRPRSRLRAERDLPAGMRIPPDVPDWDDDYAAPDER